MTNDEPKPTTKKIYTGCMRHMWTDEDEACPTCADEMENKTTTKTWREWVFSVRKEPCGFNVFWHMDECPLDFPTGKFHVVEYAALEAELVRSRSYQDDLTKCRKLLEDHQDDWKRIQDAERALEQAKAEIKKIHHEHSQAYTELMNRMEAANQHKLDRSGERCEKCGDKNWIGAPCSVPDKPAPAEELAMSIRNLTIELAAERERAKGLVEACDHKWLESYAERTGPGEIGESDREVFRAIVKALANYRSAGGKK